MHLFDCTPDRCAAVIKAFELLANAGLGSARARAALLSFEEEPVTIPLDGPQPIAARIAIRFVTPTELKHEQQVVTRPEFAILFARLRDRISTLRALYGPGPLEIDFRAMGERAAQIELLRCELHWHDTQRRSSRTGQTHPIGGFTGEAWRRW